MTQYTLVGEAVLNRIAELDSDLRDRIYDDLEVLEVDPENKAGDVHSNILEYKDDTYGHTYTIAVADGQFLIVYMVGQDYPRVWLRAILDGSTGQLL